MKSSTHWNFFAAFVMTALLSVPHVLSAEPSVACWNLPLTLSDKNTEIRFQLDSTWHEIQGTTAEITGLASCVAAQSPQNIVVSLSLPVRSFNTDNSMRDSRLMEVMLVEQYPTVDVELSGLSGGCTPALVMRDKTCRDQLSGTLTIRGTEQPVSIPVTISFAADGHFHVAGEYSFAWPDFGIEDPSIFVAKLHPIVKIQFSVELETNSHSSNPRKDFDAIYLTH
jgi:polyisoprenoid-binding protein YceI